jgi:3-isopropylmalate/(R)-2-methylmalate dehydratase large subunit
MGMTITEKILAAHAGGKRVLPGQLINPKVDLALGNDVTAPIAIDQFEKIKGGKIFDPNKVVFVLDHFTPSKDIQAAKQCQRVRTFALKHRIGHFYDVGSMGVEHALLPELGLVLPGELIVGADSHTCTYGALGAFSSGVGSTDLASTLALGELWLKVPESMKVIFRGKLREWVGAKDLILYLIHKIGVDGARYKAIEFTGNIFQSLSMDERFTITNMAIEAGAKNGIIAPDEITLSYLKGRTSKEFSVYQSDSDATYSDVIEVDVNDITPQVAVPHSPGNARPVKEIGDIPIQQVVIGSCTNGRLTDLKQAARILKGKKAHKDVRLIIIPATQNVYRLAMDEGLLSTFLDAGAAVGTPTCGPCFGGSMGVLADNERCVATTNRNFPGRMGPPTSEVYLSNPYVAAASAILGRIASPEEIA